MMKYEHPMMIITGTKDIFLKRVKRMKKMIAADCSSQQSQAGSSHNSNRKSFDSSVFLRSLRESEIEELSKENSLIDFKSQSERSYDSQAFDIYTSTIARNSDFEDNLKLKASLKDIRTNNIHGLHHLIFDMEDFDQQKILSQYKKIKPEQITSKEQPKPTAFRKSSIVITALDHNPLLDQQSQSSGVYRNYYPQNIKQIKKPFSSSRSKQQVDETIRLGNGSSTGERNLNNHGGIGRVRHIGSYRSPSFGQEKGKQTERNSPFNVHNVPDSYGEQRRWMMRQYRQPHQRAFVSNPYQNNLNPVMYQEYQQLYKPQSSSVSQVSSKAQKKQIVRQKAVALLQRVKSEERIPIFHEQIPRQMSRYQSKARF